MLLCDWLIARTRAAACPQSADDFAPPTLPSYVEDRSTFGFGSGP